MSTRCTHPDVYVYVDMEGTARCSNCNDEPVALLERFSATGEHDLSDVAREFGVDLSRNQIGAADVALGLLIVAVIGIVLLLFRVHFG